MGYRKRPAIRSLYDEGVVQMHQSGSHEMADDASRGPSFLQAEIISLRRRLTELEAVQAGQHAKIPGAGDSERVPWDFLEHIPVMLQAFDGQRNVVFWNKECARVTGYNKEEIVGNSKAMELLYPDPSYRRRIISQWRDRVDGHGKWQADMTCKDGCVRSILWSCPSALCPIEDWTVWAAGMDITDFKKARSDKLQMQFMLEGMFNATTEAMLLIGADGIICAANSTVARRLGMDREDLIGSSLKDLSPEPMPPEVLKGRIEMFQSVLDSGKAARFQDQRAGRFNDNHIYPVFDDTGRVKYVAVFSRDISEERHAMRELRKFKALCDEADYGTAITDAQGYFIYVNDAIAQMHGYKPAELIGKHILMLHNDEQIDHVRQRFKQVVEGRSMAGVEMWHIRRDGTPFPTSMNATVLYDDSGNPQFTGATLVDITEQKLREEALSRFKALADVAGHGAAMADPLGNLIYVNEAFAKMHGYRVDELLGKNLSLLHTPEQMQRVNELNERLVKAGSFVDEEVWHRSKDGREFATLMNGSLVRDEKGQPAYLGATAVDVTARKQLERRLSEYRDEMARAEKLASIGTLSAALAHEITQPLSVIRLSIQNALTAPDDELLPKAFQDLLANALAGTSQAVKLVEHFREFARKSFVRRPVSIRLAEVAESVVRLFRSTDPSRLDIRLEDLDTLPDILCDKRDAEQLFFSLVQNAVQAAGLKQKYRLVISGAVKEGCIELRFSDNCGGISPQKIDRIFDPFFSTKPVGESTGLGLSIARESVARAGGSIRVESTYGVGSTFFVTYPLDDEETYE